MFNKKIVASLLTLGVLAAVASAGTWAYFNDTMNVNNNTITAGTIILHGFNNDTDAFSIKNAIPGDNKEISNINLTNEGTIAGNLNVTVNAQPTTDTGAQNLKSHLHLKLNGNEVALGTPISLGTLEPNKANSISVHLSYSYDNLDMPQDDEMGKTVKYDITYQLIQKENMS
jgi:predicted ribosomally synthesized peptide with SipW-like signal peptide